MIDGRFGFAPRLIMLFLHVLKECICSKFLKLKIPLRMSYRHSIRCLDSQSEAYALYCA
jgi:hypothetical protein